MSLEWFEFHPKSFLTDTMRLNTEAKGAYLLLLLDYYEKEGPAPDEDEVLAAITGLSIETWRRYRRVIEPLFTVADGLWRHPTCDQVIIDSHLRIEKASKKGKDAAIKRWNRKAPGIATGIAPSKPQAMPVASSEHTTGNAHAEADFGPSMPRAMPQAMPPAMPAASKMPGACPEQCLEHATGNAPAMHSNNNKEEREGANAPSLAIGVLIDPAFMPTQGAIAEALNVDRITSTELTDWLNDWKQRCMDAGTRLEDWHAAWAREYHRRMIERAKAKPKPRVAVSKKPKLTKIPDGWEPNEGHLAIAVERKLHMRACIESFADYIVNKQPDWRDADASFRNWLKSPHRTEFIHAKAQPTHRRAPAPGGSIVDAFDRLDARIDAAAGRSLEGGEQDGQAAVLSLPEE
jgi:uncharacterized protein YdaU (DUF1376 family)